MADDRYLSCIVGWILPRKMYLWSGAVVYFLSTSCLVDHSQLSESRENTVLIELNRWWRDQRVQKIENSCSQTAILFEFDDRCDF